MKAGSTVSMTTSSLIAKSKSNSCPVSDEQNALSSGKSFNLGMIIFGGNRSSENTSQMMSPSEGFWI